MEETAGTLARNPIPGLDLGPYLARSPGALEDLARELRFICENVWFFYIENHGIPDNLIDRAFETSLQVHALPAGYFSTYFETPYIQLRMLHCPPRDEAEPDQFGAGAHTDAGFLTFLLQRGIGGLQIRRKDGVWIDAPVMPGKYLINCGDMMHRWTNERFLSTPHPGPEGRGSDIRLDP